MTERGFESFTEGLGVAGRVRSLALVNMLLALLNLSKVAWVLSSIGFRVGIMFSFPNPVPTIWDLASVPGTPTTEVPDILFGLAVTTATSVVIYLYLRRLASTGFGVKPEARPARILDVFIYELALSVLAILFAASGQLFFVLFPVFVVIYYFTFSTPYLVVFRNLSFPNALTRGAKLAMSGQYLGFVLAYIGLTLLVSVPLTVITSSAGFSGLIAGMIFGGGAGLWLTCSTSGLLNKLTSERPHGPAAEVPSETQDAVHGIDN